MSEKRQGYKYKNICLACGTILEGHSKKRHLLVNGYSVGYICYGFNKCRNPRVRRLLLNTLKNTDIQLANILNDKMVHHPTKMIEELRYLNGSKKLRWLNKHKAMVISTCRVKRLLDVCEIFNSKPETILRFLKNTGNGDIY